MYLKVCKFLHMIEINIEIFHIRIVRPREMKLHFFSIFYAYQVFYGIKSFSLDVKMEIFNQVCIHYVIITYKILYSPSNLWSFMLILFVFHIELQYNILICHPYFLLSICISKPTDKLSFLLSRTTQAPGSKHLNCILAIMPQLHSKKRFPNFIRSLA